MDHRRCTTFLSILCCVPLLSGCPDGQQVADALAQAESFSFKYLLLERDSNDRYTFGIDTAGTCHDYTLTVGEIATMFTTMTYTPIVGGGAVPTTPFEATKLDACNQHSELSYDTEDLVEVVRDGDGNLVETRRPRNPGKLVDASLRPGGTLTFVVHGVHMSLTSQSRTSTPGPMSRNVVNIPGILVGGRAGEQFDPGTLTPGYFDYTLTDILTAPDRVVGRFGMLAKTAQNDDRLLIVWDGDMVLRTDL